MKVWDCGKFIDMEIGQKVMVGHTGSGRTVFGEFGKLVRTTKQHLVFVTDSGATVKTVIDNLHIVIGKAGQLRYFVSPYVAKYEDNEEFIKSPVHIY